MDPEKVTYFAVTDARNKRTPFGIKVKDRTRHMYVIGKTGMGKSTLLENMAIQDIQNGNGLAFVDPHGSSAERLLDYVPEERMHDVIYFAPFDLERPVAFNVMEDVGYDKRHLVVSGLMSGFKKIWVDAWSARMEYILSNTLLALLEYPDSTLLDVNRMLVEKAFRKKVVEHVTDPIVKSFWVDEFANYTDRYTQEATPAIQNKIGQFTSNPLIRNIVGQATSSFNLREVMDDRKILIVNLSKGRMGETNASLLGSMLTTKIYLAAMSRADLSPRELGKLPDFYFYVDEFQSVANDSFADILSEARKYKLALVIAHQYVEQMEENVMNAVFGNIGTIVAFRVGPLDSELLEKIFAPQFTAEDLVNLGFAQIYLTLMIDGVGSQPFSATTMPLIEPPPVSHRDRVIALSRDRYGRARAEVEENIRKLHQPEPGFAEAEKSPKRPRSAFAERRPPAERPRIPDLPPPRRDERIQPPPRPHERPPQEFRRPQGPERRAEPAPTAKPISLEALRQAGRAALGRKSKGPTEESRAELRNALASLTGQKPQPSAPPREAPQRPALPPEPDRREVPEDVLRKLLDEGRS